MIYPRRKPTRLRGFDYASANYYYVTLCTQDKAPIFGHTGDLSLFGRIAGEEMNNLFSHYEDVCVDAYVVMPNHIHAILAIGCGKPARREENPTLSSVVALYKAGVSRRIHSIDPTVKVWQKSFYDEVIRDGQHYSAVWNYIAGNPQK